MNVWEWSFYGNSVLRWLVALGVAVAVLIGLRVLVNTLVRRLTEWATKSETDVDDLVVELIDRTKWLFLIIVALYAGSLTLALAPEAMALIRSVTVVALLIQAAIWGNSLISFWIGRQVKRRLEADAATATTLSALNFISKLVLWSVVLLLALANLGIDITALVAGLGVGGIAVALAVQGILGDLFASLSIVLDKPFVIGDFIVVGDFRGTVEHIGLKTTRVRSLSGEQLVFSNTDLLGSRIQNFKRMQERRITFGFGVTYQTPLEKLKKIPPLVREIIESQDLTRFDRAHFKAYGDFSLNFEVVYYVLTSDYTTYMDIQQNINFELYRRFEEEDIEFAYPTQTLFVQRVPTDRQDAAALEAELKGR